MEEDEFNQFQQTVSHQPQIPQELTYQKQQQIKEQSDLFTNNFFNFDIKNVNPYSSLATMAFQQLSDNLESKDFEDTNWPHLNKIQSENIPPLKPSLITFQKSHSQFQHKVELFDFSTTFNSEPQAPIEQNISQNQKILVTEQMQNINLTQNSKMNLDFNFSASIEANSNPTSQTLQNNQQYFENAFLNKDKPAEKVQLTQNHQIAIIKKEGNQNQQFQNDKARKQSQQFVFCEPAQNATPQANNTSDGKQSEFFIFQQQQNHQTSSTKSPSAPQLVILNHEQKIPDFDKVQYPNFNQEKTNYQESIDIFKNKENQVLNPILVTQNSKMGQKIQDEDQFGDFEENIQIAAPQLHSANIQIQIKVESQPSIVEVYYQQIPFSIDQFSKKKQLQQLVDSLPNYGNIFARAFESL